MNPLGPYGNAVAAFLAVVVILAAVATHAIPGLVPDGWLDALALLAAGIVFGTQVVQNGTQTAARNALSLVATLTSRVATLESLMPGAIAQQSAPAPAVATDPAIAATVAAADPTTTAGAGG